MSRRSTTAPSFPQLLQDFFCHRLMRDRNASAHTVASYRDTFRILFSFTGRHLGKKPSDLTLADLDSPLILEFLNHLEVDRGNRVRSRNARLAAIRSFASYAAHRDPGALPVIHRIRAIPTKRHDRPLLGFLSREEVQAILEATDCSTWSGQRDQAMWATFYNTGARVSEIVSLRVEDLQLQGKASVVLRGKGRKQRVVPLWKTTATILARWQARLNANSSSPAFPNRAGAPMTRSGVEDRLRRAVRLASDLCPTLADRRVSPHTFRHTTAMHLLQAGVDITVIALWLGHESPATTHEYVEADLAMKEEALTKLSEPSLPKRRYRPSDQLLAFLDQL